MILASDLALATHAFAASSRFERFEGCHIILEVLRVRGFQSLLSLPCQVLCELLDLCDQPLHDMILLAVSLQIASKRDLVYQDCGSFFVARLPFIRSNWAEMICSTEAICS
jgi:hypothetical protein